MNDLIIRYRKAVKDIKVDNRSKTILFELLEKEKRHLEHNVEIVNDTFGPAEAKPFEKQLGEVNDALTLPWVIGGR
jgi:hypothetical protein